MVILYCLIENGWSEVLPVVQLLFSVLLLVTYRTLLPALLGLIPLSAARTSCRFNSLNLNVLGVCFALMANTLL